MAYVGKRIYYDVETGDVILEKSESYGTVAQTTVEMDVSRYKVLSERLRETFDFIELEYGQYMQDFIESRGKYRIDVATKKLVFSYPDPNEPEVETPYRPPMSEQIDEQMTYLVDLDFRLSTVELGI